ncbi:MAG: hypothetical protein ABR612_05175 [Chromatocurvus sp.]
MTDATRLNNEVLRRWQDMLSALAAGDDIPPGLRWRTEGMMEALVLLGVHSGDELQQAMADAYQQSLGRSLETDIGADWQAGHPFPEIPFFMRRAPVHRGGHD